MFHARIDDDDKKAILKSLVATEGTCRVVFCTIAFGMGVHVPNLMYIPLSIMVRLQMYTITSKRVDVLAGMVNLAKL
jgi:superfamily II DNA helicase RecQ